MREELSQARDRPAPFDHPLEDRVEIGSGIDAVADARSHDRERIGEPFSADVLVHEQPVFDGLGSAGYGGRKDAGWSWTSTPPTDRLSETDTLI